MKQIISIILLFFSLQSFSQDTTKTTTVYQMEMNDMITKATARQTKQAFEEAEKKNVDLIIIHMNTYGGVVVDADSIRTRILNSTIPVYVFIDNNAASAGALISIACDSIYMRPGASMGAATVVNQTGEAMPDKYQSYMRSTMRATAEAKGKKAIVNGNDTIYEWRRNPKIAEAMVDPRVYIKGVIDTGKVLTFTPTEAIANGFCEGTAENIQDLLENNGTKEYKIIKYRPTTIEKIIGFLVSPMISGLLIMAIIGGIYFELQSPGIGFPLGLAVLAAILYFAPLYLEGLAANWEILLFIVGLILIALELFVIPGFGVAGVLGVLAVFIGLFLSLINNINFDFKHVEMNLAGEAIMIVTIGVFGGFLLSIYLGHKVFTSTSGAFKNMSLQNRLESSKGYVSIDPQMLALKDKTGVTQTVLRPGGKVLIDGNVYDAVADYHFIDKGAPVRVTKVEATQLYVTKLD